MAEVVMRFFPLLAFFGLGLLACSTKSSSSPSDAGSNVCEAQGGSCILRPGASCAPGFAVADPAQFPCAAGQAAEVACCLPTVSDGGQADASDGGARVCEVNGAYPGPTGQCGGQPCAPGCTCSLEHADRWTSKDTYSCACPGAPPPGSCIDVSCGAIRCGSAYYRDQSAQTVVQGPLTCSDPVQGVCN